MNPQERVEKDIKKKMSSSGHKCYEAHPLLHAAPCNASVAFSYPLQRASTASHHVAGMLPSENADQGESSPVKNTPESQQQQITGQITNQDQAQGWLSTATALGAKVYFVICCLNHGSETKEGGVVLWGNSRSLAAKNTIFWQPLVLCLCGFPQT